VLPELQAPPMPPPAIDPVMPPVPVATAVPPIPALAGSAVPPIPSLIGAGPKFEEEPRRWPIVAALIFVLLAAGAAAAWFLFKPQIRALLKM
jgi:hypothetical protein